MKRKEFLKKTGMLITVGVTVGLTGCSEDTEVGLPDEVTFDLADEPFRALGEHGGWVLHPDYDIMLVNWNDEIFAYTSVCTHSRCSRNWVFGGPEATCTCHGSKFNWRGEVVQGPAAENLKSYSLEQNGERVVLFFD